jgi:hypothetical protein
MRQLDADLNGILLNPKAGFESLSHYWLEGKDNPGFAVVTHLELIDDVGEPVPHHRFDYSLPAPDWYFGWEFVKALFIPNNGRYRLIALVVSKEPLREKPEEMTHNASPNASMQAWAHLSSIHFLDDVDDRMKLAPHP